MSRRSRNSRANLIDETSTFVHHNAVSLIHSQKITETLTLHDIKPKNYAQGQVFESFLQGNHLILTGSAGTGKSYISLYLATRKAMEDDNKSVVIIRSAVQTRDVGFTPGTLEEKEDLYAQPYKDILAKLFHRSGAWNELKKQHKVDFMSTSFVRGLTFDDTILIIDESQNMHEEELYSVLTRVGKGTQVILIGDTRQCDLNLRKEKSGFGRITEIMSKMANVDIVNFLPQDIVRSGFVRDFIMLYEAATPTSNPLK